MTDEERAEVTRAWRVEHGGYTNPPPHLLGLVKPPPPPAPPPKRELPLSVLVRFGRVRFVSRRRTL